MYPDPVIFYKGPDGNGTLAIHWQTEEPVEGILLYRSPRALAPHETEAFYSRSLECSVRCAALSSSYSMAIDPDTTPAFYCVMGRMKNGLFAIQPTFERMQAPGPVPEHAALLKSHSHEGRKLSESMPELIYANSDPKARMAAETLASGLLGRFGGHQSSTDEGGST